MPKRIRATARLSHPNVCRVYDVGEVDGQPVVESDILASAMVED